MSTIKYSWIVHQVKPISGHYRRRGLYLKCRAWTSTFCTRHWAKGALSCQIMTVVDKYVNEGYCLSPGDIVVIKPTPYLAMYIYLARCRRFPFRKLPKPSPPLNSNKNYRFLLTPPYSNLSQFLLNPENGPKQKHDLPTFPREKATFVPYGIDLFRGHLSPLSEKPLPREAHTHKTPSMSGISLHTTQYSSMYRFYHCELFRGLSSCVRPKWGIRVYWYILDGALSFTEPTEVAHPLQPAWTSLEMKYKSAEG